MSFLLPFSPKYREFKPREKEEIKKKDSNGSLKHNLIGGILHTKAGNKN